MCFSSCDNDNIGIPDGEAPGESEIENVTISIAFNPGIETRAGEGVEPSEGNTYLAANKCEICWGTEINSLYYKIFEVDTDGNLKDDGKNPAQMDVNGISTHVKLTFTLNRTKKYRLLFWAQHDKQDNESFENPYTLSTLMEVSADYSKVFNNDERLDAFYGGIDYDWKNDVRPTQVTLRRPFAQVNIGSIIADWLPSGFYDKDVVESEMTISRAATKFDINSGKASGISSSKVTFKINNIFDGPTQSMEYLEPEEIEDLSFPRGFLYVDFNENGSIDQFPSSSAKDNSLSTLDAGGQSQNVDWWRYERSRYISMAYFLVADDSGVTNSKDVVDIEFKIECKSVNNDDDGVDLQEDNATESKDMISYEVEFPNVSVRANCRTNIVGSIFTKQQRIYVNLSPVFDGIYEDTDSGDNFPDQSPTP